MTLTPERRSQIARIAGLARARAFTPEYQRATRARQTSEMCAAKGRKAFAALVRKHGQAGALEHLAAYRREHPSKLEQTVMAWLDQHNISYEREPLVNGIYCDFLLTGTKTVIECDGAIWHELHPLHRQDRASRDLVHGMALATAGYTVIRLTGAAIEDGTFADTLREQI